MAKPNETISIKSANIAGVAATAKANLNSPTRSGPSSWQSSAKKVTDKDEVSEESTANRVEEDSDSNGGSSESGSSMDNIFIEPTPKNSYDYLQEKIFGDITKASSARQLLFGAAIGGATGYLANYVGKLAALGLGGSLLLVQIAQYNGYITVDWIKVKHAVTRSQAKAKRSLMQKRNSFMEKGKSFYEENFFMATGFSAGFLFGFLW